MRFMVDVPFVSVTRTLLLFVAVSVATAANSFAAGPDPKASDDVKSADRLELDQGKVADSFERFRKNLIGLADEMREDDPTRAALLTKAVQQMGSDGTGEKFEEILQLFAGDALLLSDVKSAVEKQEEVERQLKALLTLLLTENRADKNGGEKTRIRRYLKEINIAIKVEKGIQRGTEQGGDAGDLADRQGKTAKRTEALAKEIRKNEEPGEGKPGEGKPGEGKPGEGKPGEGKPGEGKPGEGKPGEGKPGEGKPGEGKPGEGKPGDSESFPGRKRIEQAVEKMRKAEEKLNKGDLDGAEGDEADAIAELEAAKAELEEILRQLREEEIERVLAMLEARFRKMLKMQKEVYDGTVLLDQKPVEDRDRSDEIEAGRLSGKESKIVREVDKAMVLLREDGTSVAFPEAISQLREDMETVMVRLDSEDTGELTQAIEEDIIAALEEIIAILEKAQKDAKESKPGKPGKPGKPQDAPLVDKLAELKMIRGLQMRVNRRTGQYQKAIDAGKAKIENFLPKLQRLAQREDKIERLTRDIVLGRNQ